MNRKCPLEISPFKKERAQILVVLRAETPRICPSPIKEQPFIEKPIKIKHGLDDYDQIWRETGSTHLMVVQDPQETFPVTASK